MTDQTGGATEIIPGTLWAVGASVPADGEQCCMPPSDGRHVALQLYVLRDGAHAVLIDSGAKAFRPTITQAFVDLLDDVATVDVVMTRYNFDTIANLPWLRSVLPMRRLYTSLLANFALAADTIMTFMDAFEEATVDANIRSVSDIEPVYMPQDEDFAAEHIELRCVRSPIRVLTTNWIYHAATRTLFCSDAWGFASAPHDGGPRVLDDAGVEHALPELGRFLRARFDWLVGADTATIRSDVEQVFSSHPVERICPTFGAVIEGAGAVRRVVAATLAELDAMGAEQQPRSVVDAPHYPARVGVPVDGQQDLEWTEFAS